MASSRPIVVAAPSGSGKSTLIQKLMKEHEGSFGFSCSHTTRKPRPGEVDGVSYHFTSRENLEKMVADGLFIESAVFSGNMYGTSIQAVKDVENNGKRCILDIDIQGVISVKKTDLNPIYIFIRPPSIEELKKRLLGRGDTAEDQIAIRLEAARKELEYADKEGFFDFIVVNEDLEKAYSEFKNIILNN